LAGQRLANTSALDQLKFARGLALIPSIGLVTGNALHVADISRAALARSLAKIVLQIDAFFGDARAIALKNLVDCTSKIALFLVAGEARKIANLSKDPLARFVDMRNDGLDARVGVAPCIPFEGPAWLARGRAPGGVSLTACQF
jgi:hypothetical protein